MASVRAIKMVASLMEAPYLESRRQMRVLRLANLPANIRRRQILTQDYLFHSCLGPDSTWSLTRN